jgi:hypothetical protein
MKQFIVVFCVTAVLLSGTPHALLGGAVLALWSLR